MPLLLEWPGLPKLVEGLKLMRNLDCTPLMLQWGSILIEGNRRGVLAGLDGNNQPMPALKYRDGHGKPTRNRRVPHYGTSRFETSGAGPYATGLNDNLSPAAYRELTGPRLAPRGEASRVIKNLHQMVEICKVSENRWQAVCAWNDVISNSGEPFLIAHFEGLNHEPKYDLRPVRPEDYAFCMNALSAFAKKVFFDSI